VAIHRTSDVVLEKAQQDLKLILEPAGPTDEAPSAKIVNAEAIRKLLIASAFDFAGRRWSIPTLSFHEGVTALRYKNEALRMNKYVASGVMLDEYEVLCQKVAMLVWRVVVPVGGWTLRELVWRRFGWSRNPFLVAGDADIGAILDFCLLRRTTSTVSLPESDD
jgi:hypothetical protein